nr:hypothetical protein [Tanacetum cinerariifolium]
MEEPIEVLEVNITIRSDLSFLTDVKKKLDQPGNEKHKTLFLATKFGIWLDLPAFANDNHLLNYIFHHQVYAEPSVEFPPISYRICCNTFEFGRVCLKLVATIVFMGRETRYNIPDNNEKDSKKDKDKSVKPPKKKIKVGKDSKKKNKYVEVSPEKMTRYNLYWFVWAIKFDAISPDDYDKPNNSYSMNKEDVLGELDAIKATIPIIDNKNGEVSAACLEKQLDLVKDRILVLEKALQQRYQNAPEDSVKQACKSDSGVSDVFHQELASEKHQFISEGSVYIYEETQDKYSVSQLLQLASNDKSGMAFDCTQLEVDNPIDWSLPNLNEPFSQSQICGFVCYDDMLVHGDMMANEQNISETKSDETVVVQELHPPPKPASLIDNLEASFGSDDMLGPVVEDHINFDTSTKVFQDRVNMMAIEENISDKNFLRR